MKTLIFAGLLSLSTMAMADVEIIETPKPVPQAPAPQVQTVPQVQVQTVPSHAQLQVMLDPYAMFRQSHYDARLGQQLVYGHWGDVVNVVARMFTTYHNNVRQNHVVGFDVTAYSNGKFYTFMMDHQPPRGASVQIPGM
jgi:hypothetical protein